MATEASGSRPTTAYAGAEAEIRDLLGIPETIHVAALVPVGDPDGSFRDATRKPVDQVAFLDRWGASLP